jgi:hypothetical protein
MKKLVFAALAFTSSLAFASPPQQMELQICAGAGVGGFVVKCVVNGEPFENARDTSLFAQYEQGWRLVATQSASANGGSGRLASMVMAHAFFMEREKKK